MQQASFTSSATAGFAEPRPARHEPADQQSVRLPLLLLRELQHRTANTLNFAGLLLELSALRSASPEMKNTLQNIAATFRLLVAANQHFSVPDPDAVADAATEIRATCARLSLAYATTRPGIRVDCVIAEQPRFAVRPAGVLSLIVNELMTNAFKHAFRGRDTGFLLVTLGLAGHGRACLSVIDDGPGFAPTSASAGGKGMGLVEALAETINGVVSISGEGCRETTVSVTFPALRPPPDPAGEGH